MVTVVQQCGGVVVRWCRRCRRCGGYSGAAVWCSSVMQQCGAAVWCNSGGAAVVVQQCGAVVWCSGAVVVWWRHLVASSSCHDM